MKKTSNVLLVLSLLLLRLAAPLHAAPQVVTQTIAQSKSKVYTVKVQVTQYAIPTTAQARINDALMRQARKAIAHFTKTALRDNADKLQVWDLTTNSIVKHRSDRWLSIFIVGGEYTGGAHPIPSMQTRLFDVGTAGELRLSQLFKPGVPYLKLLAKKCRTQLMTRDDVKADKKWATDGSAPKAENYGVFYIDGKNLVIVFTPYQVAPYASGAPEVKIPYAELNDIAAPGGPLVAR